MDLNTKVKGKLVEYGFTDTSVANITNGFFKVL